VAGGANIDMAGSSRAPCGSAAVARMRVESMHGEMPESVDTRVGLVVALVAAVVALIATTCSATDFYSWVDESGRVHYSNAPSEVPAGTAATRVTMKEGAMSSGASRRQAGTEADGEAEEKVESRDDVEARLPPPSGVAEKSIQPTSAQASLARYDLRRELSDAEAQVADIDRKLSELADVRMQHANRPHPSVGGLRAVGAGDVRSPEEDALEERRKGLTKQIEDIRARLTALPTQ